MLGLVGENGAGKSTLIKILCGVLAPDSGEVIWRGQQVQFASPRDAFDVGIAAIHQELAYFGKLSVAENLLFGERWPRTKWHGVDWKGLHRTARERLDSFGLDVDSRCLFETLSAAEKQEVALARALSRDARLVILDEPTASLTEPEVERLFQHLERLRDEGVALLYISHRLDEILQLTDRVAVLRDGELVAEYPRAETTVDRMVRDMVGRDLKSGYPNTRGASQGEVLLELDRLTVPGFFDDVSLSVRSGEIVGMAGLVGAGRSELARAIYGLYPAASGSMRLHGRPWNPRGPHAALAQGLVYLPEERKAQALVLDHSLKKSISIGFSDLLARLGLISPGDEERRTAESIRRCHIRATGGEQVVGTLSGGNQQKAVLARWLGRSPEVLILDEPTRGVDIAAKAEIHALIDQLAAEGKGVLMISSDLPEILAMCDRVLVMHGGRLAAELTGEDRTQRNVILAASGLQAGDDSPMREEA